MVANRILLILVMASMFAWPGRSGDAAAYAAQAKARANRQNDAAATADPVLERLIQELLSEDAKIARDAQKELTRMGAAVPALFQKLVKSGWDIKQPLLEVLAEITEARDYARVKLFHGTEEEKTYAAILYELIDLGEDTTSRAYAVMVEALLKALKSEDKSLRAAAGLALINSETSTLFFEHLHEIVPALISSFDTALVIGRRSREDPTTVVFWGICLRLDTIIGDRLAFADVKETLRKKGASLGTDHSDLRRTMVRLLAAGREEVDGLRAYWNEWWKAHASMSAVEIGALIIERNLRILPNRRADSIYSSMAHRSSAETERYLSANWSLELWAGVSCDIVDDDWGAWWDQRKATYAGPKPHSRR